MKVATFFNRMICVIAWASIILACSPSGPVRRATQVDSRLNHLSQSSYVRVHSSHLPRGGDFERIESTQGLEGWLGPQAAKSVQGLFLNISPPGAALGAVSASPSRQDPDYYYHWVRDSSLVMGVVLDLYEGSSSVQDRDFILKTMEQYVDFSRLNQITPNLSGGVGEPKYNVNGTAFTGEWGRPQNDGPALRAVTLIRFAKLLLAAGNQESYVRSKLYDGFIPSESLIKTDLEFVSHHWRESCFDLWEDTKGIHFYARMVQRRALVDGAELADLLGDGRAAIWYRSQAQAIEVEILKHWDSERGYFVETLSWDGGNSNKASGLDVAVVLGVLHGRTSDGFLSPGNDLVVATAEKLREVFKNSYAVNQNPGMGTAIGRYPEDSYDGLAVGVRPGNPWVLSTFAFAELNYRIAQEWGAQGRVDVTALNLPYLRAVLGDSALGKRWLRSGARLERGQADFDLLMSRIRETGDSYMTRVKYHTPRDGALAEQFNRDTGFMQGARDLAWSYASFITALAERSRLLSHPINR